MSALREKPSREPQPVCHMFTPIGMLGYGFDEQEMHRTLEKLSQDSIPTALVVDSGSTDSGPKKLATGDTTCPRSAYKRDLGRLLNGIHLYKVPLLIGSAGGSGMNAQVDLLTEIVEELSQERKCSFEVVQIYSEIPKAVVSQRLRKNKITGCGIAVPQMQQADVDDSSLIVAQMGPEPYLEAMERHPQFDIIIGGRAYDPVPYVAFATACLRKQDPRFDKTDETSSKIYGGLYHSSKIMECGGLCATPKSAGATTTIYPDGSFDIVPTDTKARCTPLSVAAHTLYEKTRPDILPGPGGWLDLNKAEYEQRPDSRTVRVRGGVFHSSIGNGKPYQVKLEAARNKGFRSMYMGYHRDPILISQIGDQLARIKGYAASQLEDLEDGAWDLDFHVYGRDSTAVPKSIFIIAESRAKSQEQATAIAGVARTATIHGSYPGQKATSGNFAFGIGGMTEFPLGPCSEFCIYHLMDLEPGEEESLFRIESRGTKHCEGCQGSYQVKRSVERSESSQSSHRIAVEPPKPTEKACGSDTDDPRTINDLAKILRSKNAGPYEMTFDILFDRKDVYETIKSSQLLTAERVAALYDMDTEQVIWSGFFDQALAFKATIPRRRRGLPCASGGYFEDDVHGSQMYIPLMEVELPEDLRRKLKALN